MVVILIVYSKPLTITQITLETHYFYNSNALHIYTFHTPSQLPILLQLNFTLYKRKLQINHVRINNRKASCITFHEITTIKILYYNNTTINNYTIKIWYCLVSCILQVPIKLKTHVSYFSLFM